MNKEDNFLDHLILGRKLTLPMFIATLVATWYGGIFGVTKISFNHGIFNFITQGLFWYISYIIFALFIVKKITPYKALTLPDLIGKMFGPTSAKIAAIFNILNVLPIVYVISLGLFLQTLFGGPLSVNMTIGLSFVIIYSLFGGIRAVIFSDLVQFFVMCLAVAMVAIFSYLKFGGITYLKSHLPATHFEITGGHSVATLLVWGFIALSTLIDPNFYQRVFAAKSSKTATRGILYSTIIWFLFDICTTLGGMYARAALPTHDPGHAYLDYALTILPVGMRGLILAGILATILSTLDSYLFLGGATITNDLLKKRSSHHLYFNTVLVGLITLLVAHFFDGDIKMVWKVLGSYSASCMLLPILINYIIPARISDSQFTFSTLMGALGMTIWIIWGSPQVEFFYVGVLSTSAGLLLSRFILK